MARSFSHPRRAWAVLSGGAVAGIVLFYGVSLLGDPHRYLGIPGSAAALFAVMAAVVTGPWIGTAVALGGGVAFALLVALPNDRVAPIAATMSIAL